MNFPFVEFVGFVEDRIYRPMIPVSFHANKNHFNTYALIDSGSDYTILPIEVAGIFEFKLSDQTRYSVLGAGGSTFEVYRSPVEVEYCLKQKGHRDIKWHSLVYFAESGSTSLLGLKGFFNHLHVALDGKNRKIEISK